MIGPETQVVLHDHREGEPCNARCVEVPRASEDTEPNEQEHIDHDERCCREHGTHSMPHKGCILR